MPALPPRPSLEQVRRLAKDLLRDRKEGDRTAIRRLAVVSGVDGWRGRIRTFDLLIQRTPNDFIDGRC